LFFVPLLTFAPSELPRFPRAGFVLVLLAQFFDGPWETLPPEATLPPFFKLSVLLEPSPPQAVGCLPIASLLRPPHGTINSPFFFVFFCPSVKAMFESRTIFYTKPPISLPPPPSRTFYADIFVSSACLEVSPFFFCFSWLLFKVSFFCLVLPPFESRPVLNLIGTVFLRGGFDPLFSLLLFVCFLFRSFSPPGCLDNFNLRSHDLCSNRIDSPPLGSASYFLFFAPRSPKKTAKDLGFLRSPYLALHRQTRPFFYTPHSPRTIAPVHFGFGAYVLGDFFFLNSGPEPLFPRHFPYFLPGKPYCPTFRVFWLHRAGSRRVTRWPLKPPLVRPVFFFATLAFARFFWLRFFQAIHILCLLFSSPGIWNRPPPSVVHSFTLRDPVSQLLFFFFLFLIQIASVFRKAFCPFGGWRSFVRPLPFAFHFRSIWVDGMVLGPPPRVRFCRVSCVADTHLITFPTFCVCFFCPALSFHAFF